MERGETATTVAGMTENSPPEVVVAGAGLAALELVLALRDLAGDRVGITVIAPEADFVARPLLVADPLGAAPAPRRPLREIADDAGFTLLPGAVAAVDGRERRVRLHSGAAVRYDTLVLAPGAKSLPAFEDAIHIGAAGTRAALERLREEIGRGEVRSVAFVAPTTTGWLLPLYEAALLTARMDARVSLVTAEEAPLAVFGAAASAAVARELQAAGVAFAGGRQATVAGGAVVIPGAPPIAADRIVSLPLLRGPRIPGVPETGLYGLIPVDAYGR